MNKSLTGLIALVIAAAGILGGCKKNGEPNAPAGKIAVSKLTIKIDERDTMLFVGADTNKAVTWTIKPAGQNTLKTFKTAAFVQFSKAGTYVISAGSSDIEARPVTITVIDSVYEPPVSFIYFDESEEITVVPYYVKSATSDSSYIGYTATTKNKYCNNYMLSAGGYLDTNTGWYFISLDGASLKVPVGPCSKSVLLSRSIDYRSYQPKLLPGTYTLFGGFGNGVDSGNGTIEVTDKQIIFHWDDSHHIIISPKVLAR